MHPATPTSGASPSGAVYATIDIRKENGHPNSKFFERAHLGGMV